MWRGHWAGFPGALALGSVATPATPATPASQAHWEGRAISQASGPQRPRPGPVLSCVTPSREGRLVVRGQASATAARSVLSASAAPVRPRCSGLGPATCTAARGQDPPAPGRGGPSGPPSMSGLSVGYLPLPRTSSTPCPPPAVHPACPGHPLQHEQMGPPTSWTPLTLHGVQFMRLICLIKPFI